ncbi:hypothetical protein F5050DRAFT_1724013 [Lentinula boryana]|uniref:F-box domain-containing protein n=1 Tax=Lentinula boryana TaxID=40481 RepID=A0ABQ8QSY6_9AGAR|nr:hypothetical protein F5050DRAFT_1724013 [Lentinula boryana]
MVALESRRSFGSFGVKILVSPKYLLSLTSSHSYRSYPKLSTMSRPAKKFGVQVLNLTFLLNNNEPPSHQIPIIDELIARDDEITVNFCVRFRAYASSFVMKPVPTTDTRIDDFLADPEPSLCDNLYPLSLVCRKWRNVALSTCALVHNLCIPLVSSISMPRCGSHFLQTFHFLLCPLAVYVFASGLF